MFCIEVERLSFRAFCRGIFAFFAALGRLHLCRKAESFALWLSNPFALEKYCAHSVPNFPMPVRKA